MPKQRLFYTKTATELVLCRGVEQMIDNKMIKKSLELHMTEDNVLIEPVVAHIHFAERPLNLLAN